MGFVFSIWFVDYGIIHVHLWDWCLCRGVLMPVFNIENISIEYGWQNKGELEIKGSVLYRSDDTLKDLMKVVSDIWNKNIYFMEEHVTKCIYQGEEHEPITVYLRLTAPNDMTKCAIKLILRTISDIVRIEDYRWYNNVFKENLL